LAVSTCRERHAARLARRYVVRVSEDGSLRLTVPRGASIAGGFAFAERQSDWVMREMERQRLRLAPWVTGTRAWFRVEQVEVDVDATRAVVGEVIALIRRTVTATPSKPGSGDWRPKNCPALGAGANRPQRLKVSVRDQRRAGRVFGAPRHHAELAAGADAAQRPRLRHLSRADAHPPSEPLAPLLARGRSRVLVVARGRALAAGSRTGIAALRQGRGQKAEGRGNLEG
jgi:hypothetical protein